MKQGKSILLVEEDPLITEYLIRRLQQWGFDVFGAHESIIDAILSIESDQLLPDLLLVNIPFAKQDNSLLSLELFQFLYPISVIIMSTNDVSDCLQGSAFLPDGLLLKPFTEVQLSRAVGSA